MSHLRLRSRRRSVLQRPAAGTARPPRLSQDLDTLFCRGGFGGPLPSRLALGRIYDWLDGKSSCRDSLVGLQVTSFTRKGSDMRVPLVPEAEVHSSQRALTTRSLNESRKITVVSKRYERMGRCLGPGARGFRFRRHARRSASSLRPSRQCPDSARLRCRS
jgi:hypothetical protein